MKIIIRPKPSRLIRVGTQGPAGPGGVTSVTGTLYQILVNGTLDPETGALTLSLQSEVHVASSLTTIIANVRKTIFRTQGDAAKFVAIQGPESMSDAEFTYTLPATAPTNGQVLSATGLSGLSASTLWVTPSPGGLVECFTGITGGATLQVPNLTRPSYYQVPFFATAITLEKPDEVATGVLLQIDNTLNPDNGTVSGVGGFEIAGGGIQNLLYNGTAWVP